MAVKVLITRRFQEGKDIDVFSFLSQLRTKAMNQHGYITGETLFGHDDPQKLLVISTWQSVNNWLKWKTDPERTAIEKQLEECLLGPTEYEVFAFGTYPTRE